MRREKLYTLTLIIPFSLFSIWLMTAFAMRGLKYIEVLASTFKDNWVHIIPAIIGIIIGIELFKKKLINSSSPLPSYRKSFFYIFKIWILVASINIGTYLLEGAVKFPTNDYLSSLITLISVSIALYLIVAIIFSLLIGLIIYKFSKKSS